MSKFSEKKCKLKKQKIANTNDRHLYDMGKFANITLYVAVPKIFYHTHFESLLIRL